MSTIDTDENKSQALSQCDRGNVNSNFGSKGNIPENGDWVLGPWCLEYGENACGSNANFPDKGHISESLLQYIRPVRPDRNLLSRTISSDWYIGWGQT